MMSKIRKAGRFFFYLTKRQLKKPSLWVVFFLLFLSVIFFPKMEQEENNEIQVGIYLEKIDSYTGEEELLLAEKLRDKATDDSLFSFVIYKELYLMEQDILSGKLECGYKIPSDLWEKLGKGKTKNLVTLYTSATTTMDGICNEVLYAKLYEEQALRILNDYLFETKFLGYKNEDEIRKVTEPIYRKYLTDGSTFGFQIKEIGAEKKAIESGNESKTNVLVYPLRGFLAVFVLVCGFCGSLMHYEDREKRIFIRQTKKERSLLCLISISIPVLLACPMVLGCLWGSGIFTDGYKETKALFFYAILVILFCQILTYCLKDKVVFCSCIPILLIGCILFTPVLFEISAFIPQVKMIEKLFVPYYYLRLFL